MPLRFPKTYPRNSPDIKLENPRGLTPVQMQQLRQELSTKVREQAGKEVIYELATLIQEFLSTHNNPPPRGTTLSFHEQMLHRKEENEKVWCSSGYGHNVDYVLNWKLTGHVCPRGWDSILIIYRFYPTSTHRQIEQEKQQEELDRIMKLEEAERQVELESINQKIEEELRRKKEMAREDKERRKQLLLDGPPNDVDELEEQEAPEIQFRSVKFDSLVLRNAENPQVGVIDGLNRWIGLSRRTWLVWLMLAFRCHATPGSAVQDCGPGAQYWKRCTYAPSELSLTLRSLLHFSITILTYIVNSGQIGSIYAVRPADIQSDKSDIEDDTLALREIEITAAHYLTPNGKKKVN